MCVYCIVCLRSSYPFYAVGYNIKWVTTSWTYSITRSIQFYCCNIRDEYCLFSYTVCPRSSDPFDVVSYQDRSVTISWTYSTLGHLYTLFIGHTVYLMNGCVF